MASLYAALRSRTWSHPAAPTSSPPGQPSGSSRSAASSSSSHLNTTAPQARSRHSESSSRHNVVAQPAQRRRDRTPRARALDDGHIFSTYSTPSVHDSLWFCADFMTGAGMVVLQPATGKVLLLYEPRRDYWFFPKGRKDVGESLERTALREAYEESGYHVDFLPLYLPTNAPLPPEQRAFGRRPCTEPFYVTTQVWGPRRRRRTNAQDMHEDNGGEYITFWYIGQIPADATYQADTGMPDEKEYQSHLLHLEDACARLCRCKMDYFASLLRIAYDLWLQTKAYTEREAAAAQETETELESADK